MSHITLALYKITSHATQVSQHTLTLDLDEHDAASFYDQYDEWLEHHKDTRDNLMDELSDAAEEIREAEQHQDETARIQAVARHSDILEQLHPYNGVEFTAYVHDYSHDEDDTQIERHMTDKPVNAAQSKLSTFNEDAYYEEQELREDSFLPSGVLDAALALDIPLEDADAAYRGQYSTAAAYAQQHHEDRGTELGALAAHIDWDSVANDLQQSGGICEHNGHYFDPDW